MKTQNRPASITDHSNSKAGLTHFSCKGCIRGVYGLQRLESHACSLTEMPNQDDQDGIENKDKPDNVWRPKCNWWSRLSDRYADGVATAPSASRRRWWGRRHGEYDDDIYQLIDIDNLNDEVNAILIQNCRMIRINLRTSRCRGKSSLCSCQPEVSPEHTDGIVEPRRRRPRRGLSRRGTGRH